MNNDRFQVVGLYEHNIISYLKIEKAFASGETRVAIVHATGTGKTYNAKQLAYDNRYKKILYIVPLTGIVDHIKQTINDNPNLDFQDDFPNLEFRTYHSLISLSREEIANIDCDILIIDEFHHIGAPVWGERIKTIIETHPNIKILGMTAYTIRDRGTPYERDMVDPTTDEIFSGKVVSRYDLCDAMIDGVLPEPIYRSARHLIKLANDLELLLQKQNPNTQTYQECLSLLAYVKKRIHEAQSIPTILRKNIKPNGKYIYFCPPASEKGTNDIETIKKQAFEWFKQFVPEEDIIFYTSTSEMGAEGKHNRDAFYNDITLDGKKADHKLRIMFAINQYNEGIHAPNIDGVIMGRSTSSDIVFFEQLGRALAVRGNTKEKFEALEIYSLEQLTEMCKRRDITVKENEDNKEDLIQKLLAPVIIDLADNYSYIRELENNLQNRIKEIKKSGNKEHRHIKIKDVSFDIEIENQDLFEMLIYIRDRLTMTWEDYYKLAKAYYDYHGDLLIPIDFKTINGYEYNDNGVNLRIWINRQRRNYDNLSEEKKTQLTAIHFITSVHDYNWYQHYKLAKAYYNFHGNLLIPIDFKTINGYEDNNKGVNLGKWIGRQRENYDNLSEEKKSLLAAIHFIANTLIFAWYQHYELAKAYYNYHGNLLIRRDFKTINGYEYDKHGFGLGVWITKQRKNYDNLSDEQKAQLAAIHFIVSVYDYNWYQYYELAKVYYNYHGNLLIRKDFKTTNGYEYDENGFNLGIWLTHQRSLTPEDSERGQLLSQIGMVWKVRTKRKIKK